MYLKVLRIIVGVYVAVYEVIDMIVPCSPDLTAHPLPPDQVPLISSMTFLTPTTVTPFALAQLNISTKFRGVKTTS